MDNIMLLKIALTLTAAALGTLLLWKRLRRKWRFLWPVAAVLIGLFAHYLSSTLAPVNEVVRLTALGTKNEASGWYQVILAGYAENDVPKGFFYFNSGSWLKQEKDETSNESMYLWVPEGDELWEEGITDTLEVMIPAGSARFVIFYGGPYGGQVLLEYNGAAELVDTYAEFNREYWVPLADSSPEVLYQSELSHVPAFCLTLCLVSFAAIGAIWFFTAGSRITKLKKYEFLFEELVKRDFTLKYKRTILGMLWSIISPLVNLLIMWLVFRRVLGAGNDHYVIYLFSGQMVFSYFSDATTLGMTSLLDNAPIFTKVNVPKYLFLLSKNTSSLINFGLTLLIYFIFVAADGLSFHLNFFMLLYPIICAILFNVGMGMILSALFVFFRDMQYLWGIATQLIMWLSAIFYSIDTFPYATQSLFLINPVYLFIRYFRKIVIESTVPTIQFHLLMLAYTLLALGAGCLIYKKYNHEFLYYV